MIQSEAGFVISLDFAPDGRLFYAQQDGKIFTKRIDFEAPWDSPPPTQILEINVARGVESGLLGLALSPSFAQDHYFFLYYTVPNEVGQPIMERIVRFTEKDNTAIEETVIMDGLPARPDQQFHFGGGLSFGPDGALYLIFGETNLPTEAKNPQSPHGSILRYNPDGTIPQDNPFPGSAVFAYGIRNGFGLAWHPQQEWLYEAENGESCDDEINLIEPGLNYGWGVHPYNTCPYPDDHATPPIYEWNPIIAPAGMAFYSGEVIPEWNGDLFVCSFNDLELHRLVLSKDGRNVHSAEIVKIPGMDYTCRVDVTQGPDDWLYTSTDSTIFRIGR